MDAEAATDGDLVYLRGASFRDYERLVEIRGDHGSPRLAYLDGTIELVSPSAEHEEVRSLLGRLLEAWCLARDVRFTALGQWTLKRAPKEAGLEPDECYVFHRPRGRRTRPDLAIEVQHSRRAVHKLEIYRRLGVREVWLWENGQLEVHALRGARYEAVERSEALPDIDLSQLVSFLDRPTTYDAIRDYTEALRQA